MSSLSYFLHVPNVSASYSSKLCFSQAPAMSNHLACPISITKDHRLRATIKGWTIDAGVRRRRQRSGVSSVGVQRLECPVSTLLDTQTNKAIIFVIKSAPALTESSPAADGNGKECGSITMEELPEGLKRELMPKHVAIFTDGNRRWGRKQGLSANSGYEVGTMTAIETVKLCSRWGIPVISMTGSHVRNWDRPEEEMIYMFDLIKDMKTFMLSFFQKEGVRFSMIGDRSKLLSSMVSSMHEAEEATKHNAKTHCILSVDYTGSNDIIQACKSISQKVKDGTIQREDINEKLMGQELATKCEAKFPEPDLMIRTGGHKRLSDYYLWQSAYSELYFSDVLWPDFGKNEFIEALASFQERKRGYGRRG